jgi:hypothetical protein
MAFFGQTRWRKSAPGRKIGENLFGSTDGVSIGEDVGATAG